MVESLRYPLPSYRLELVPQGVDKFRNASLAEVGDGTARGDQLNILLAIHRVTDLKTAMWFVACATFHPQILCERPCIALGMISSVLRRNHRQAANSDPGMPKGFSQAAPGPRVAIVVSDQEDSVPGENSCCLLENRLENSFVVLCCRAADSIGDSLRMEVRAAGSITEACGTSP